MRDRKALERFRLSTALLAAFFVVCSPSVAVPGCGLVDGVLDGTTDNDSDSDGIPDCLDDLPLESGTTATNPTACVLDVDTENDGDDGECVQDCTLREAIGIAATGTCTIHLPPGTYDVGSASLQMYTSTAIVGAGAERTTLVSSATDAITYDIAFSAQPLFVSGLTIQVAESGFVADEIQLPITLSNTILQGSGSAGIGIHPYAEGGIVRLNNSIIRGFTVGIDAPWGAAVGGRALRLTENELGLHLSGGAPSGASAVLEDCELTYNSARAIVVQGATSGPSVGAPAILTLRRCLVASNSVNVYRGGAIWLQTTLNSGAHATIEDSSFIDNFAPEAGGAIYVQTRDHQSSELVVNGTTFSGNSSARGGAISFGDFPSSADNAVTNSTFSGNTATESGGAIFGSGSRLSLLQTTFTGNSAPSGGGIYNESSVVPSNLTLERSVLGANGAPIAGPECFGAIGSLGHNLLQDPSGCSFTPLASDLTGIGPGLEPLGLHGGPTATHPPDPAGPLVDAGGTCTGIDQRGVVRPQGTACDIGAVETTTDFDDDGILDEFDVCPYTADPGQSDGDTDGVGDACDNCPELSDPDQDDPDLDGVGTPCDVCPWVADPEQDDGDGDGIGDSCDNCPGLADSNQDDTDGDGAGDPCDPCPQDAEDDTVDGDGVCPTDDNCVAVFNPEQHDSDDDALGDSCDNCPGNPNPSQEDADGDGLGDACDPCPLISFDADGDGYCAEIDNCPTLFNPGQEDLDADGTGDACDSCPIDPLNDADGDGLCSDADNCAALWNGGQEDSDSDGIGDVCDACPNDSANDADADGRCADTDNCPTVANPGNFESEETLLYQWASSATASSEYSQDLYAAFQSTGAPESAGVCEDRETNWSPNSGTTEPEWLELTYPTPVRATGVSVHESYEDAIVGRLDLRDPFGVAQAVWVGPDTTTCGNTLDAGWAAPAFRTDTLTVTTVAEWEQIDAVELVGWAVAPDGVGTACDNCPRLPNPNQTDTDGDGAGDPCDCAPTDPNVLTPAVLTDVLIDKVSGDPRILWDAEAGADRYELIRGSMTLVRTGSFGDCIADVPTGTEFDDLFGPEPPPGVVLTYLVRGVSNSCGAGGIGYGREAIPREYTGAACP